jgi:hypothetical protein
MKVPVFFTEVENQNVKSTTVYTILVPINYNRSISVSEPQLEWLFEQVIAAMTGLSRLHYSLGVCLDQNRHSSRADFLSIEVVAKCDEETEQLILCLW